MNDPLYNHPVFGEQRGRAGQFGKSEEQLIADLVKIHNAENWLGEDGEFVSLDPEVLSFSHIHWKTVGNCDTGCKWPLTNKIKIVSTSSKTNV